VIGVNFRVGSLKLTGQDMPQLERSVNGIRKSTTDGLRHLREREAAMKRLQALLLRKVQDAVASGL
jgi:hypothetical protein